MRLSGPAWHAENIISHSLRFATGALRTEPDREFCVHHGSEVHAMQFVAETAQN